MTDSRRTTSSRRCSGARPRRRSREPRGSLKRRRADWSQACAPGGSDLGEDLLCDGFRGANCALDVGVVARRMLRVREVDVSERFADPWAIARPDTGAQVAGTAARPLACDVVDPGSVAADAAVPVALQRHERRARLIAQI